MKRFRHDASFVRSHFAGRSANLHADELKLIAPLSFSAPYNCIANCMQRRSDAITSSPAANDRVANKLRGRGDYDL